MLFPETNHVTSLKPQHKDHMATKNMYSLLCLYAHHYTEFLPEVEHILAMREKQIKKRILLGLPRRMSDRIAIKSAIKEEDVRCMHAQSSVSGMTSV